MSVLNRTFVPIWLRDGKCPGDERHFRGVAREVYSYMKLHAQRNGGFVFAGIADIARHTKNWHKEKQPFSYSQCKRVLRTFRALGVIGKYGRHEIQGREYLGWQFYEHAIWTEVHGGICEFKRWSSYESDSKGFPRQNAPGLAPGVAPDILKMLPTLPPVMLPAMLPQSGAL